MVREQDVTMQSTPQDHQLMSKHHVLSSGRTFDLNGEAASRQGGL